MDFKIFISIILIAGVIQGIFLSIVLITIKRGNKSANKILAVIIFLFTLMILPHTKIGAQTNDSGNLPGEYIIHMIFFLIPPLIFFYVKFITSSKFNIFKKELNHLLPFAGAFIIFLLLIGIGAEEKLWKASGSLLTLLIVIQVIIYLYYSIKLLRIHSNKIKESFSYIEKINLNWLRFLLIGQMILWPLLLVFEIIKIEPHETMWIPLSIFIYLMGYLGLRQPEIFSGIMPEENKEIKIAKKKYERSTLTSEMSDIYYCRLIEIMKNNKPFIEKNLTLQSLASLTSIPTHHLSQIINEKCNQNFYEFVNGYRIEEAKKLLADSQKDFFTIAAIGFEVGFNSVSSFNSVFKKITNTTPSQFRNSH